MTATGRSPAAQADEAVLTRFDSHARKYSRKATKAPDAFGMSDGHQHGTS